MAAETSEQVTLELHGFLAERLADLGHRRGTRVRVAVAIGATLSVGRLLASLVDGEPRYGLLFDAQSGLVPEHVEIVLNDRVLDLQGGLSASLRPGDTLTFLPAHAGG